MVFYYFDALAGAGKTFSIIKYADELASQGLKVLIVQPSRLLIGATIETELRPRNPTYNVTEIHGDTNPGGVVRALVEFFKQAKEGEGEIAFVTHVGFLGCPHIHRRHQWVVIIDEALGVTDTIEKSVPISHQMITSHLTVRPIDEKYGELTVGNRAAMNILAENKGQDANLSIFSMLAKQVVSANWHVSTLVDQYELLIGKPSPTLRRKMTTFSELQPSILYGFKQVILCSALFKQTLLYQLWSQRGAEFEPVGPRLTDSLKYDQHPHGDRLTIFYASTADWSKGHRNMPVAEGGRFLDLIKDAVVKLYGEDPFVWMGNVDLADDLFGLPGAARLPNSPHGLNSFQHIHNCVVLSALNPTPAFYAWMKTRGVDGVALKAAIYRSAVYQAFVRCSIRDPKRTEPKQLVVMDLNTAEFIQQLFPGSKIQALPGMGIAPIKKAAARPRLHATDDVRVAAYRADKKAQLQRDLARIRQNSFLVHAPPSSAGANACNETLLTTKPFVTPKSAQIALPIYKSIKARDPMVMADGRSAVLDYASDDVFIDLLRWCSAELDHQDKHDGCLISPAHFEPHPFIDTARGLENITYLHGIWLDNDGGDLSHEAFAALFPYLRVVVYSTFSSTAAQPRWRVFIPTSHAMTIEIHAMIIDQLLADVNKAGFWCKKQLAKTGSISSRQRHGFDPSKYTASSLFYLPGQAQDPGDTFFVDHNGPFRTAINVPLWLDGIVQRSPVELDDQTSTTPHVAAEGSRSTLPLVSMMMRNDIQTRNAVGSADKIKNAIADWQATPKGQGNAEFFRLAARLNGAGMAEADIRSTLFEQADRARSSAERKKEINGIMKSLAKSGSMPARRRGR